MANKVTKLRKSEGELARRSTLLRPCTRTLAGGKVVHSAVEFEDLIDRHGDNLNIDWVIQWLCKLRGDLQYSRVRKLDTLRACFYTLAKLCPIPAQYHRLIVMLDYATKSLQWPFSYVYYSEGVENNLELSIKGYIFTVVTVDGPPATEPILYASVIVPGRSFHRDEPPCDDEVQVSMHAQPRQVVGDLLDAVWKQERNNAFEAVDYNERPGCEEEAF